MEFFSQIETQSVSAEQIFELVTIDGLPELCASIDSVISIESQSKGQIYCVWGQFHISREKIRNGVRLSLLDCPHALAWTITAKHEVGILLTHCTIDDKMAEIEFIETIEQFVNDWSEGLKAALL